MALGAVKSFGMRVLGIDDNDVPNEKKYVSLVEKHFKKRDKSVLEQYHRQWFYNIAMRRGHQWLRMNASTGEFLPPSEDQDCVRMTINEMLGVHTTKVAKLTRENPVWTVSIDTEDEDSRDVARNNELLLKYAFQREDIELSRLFLLSWAVDTGNGFWKIDWDHEAGDLIEDPFTGETVPQGDVRFIVVPPFDITMSYNTKTRIEDALWVIHSHEEPLEVIKEDWERGELVKGETEKDHLGSYQKRLMALVGNQSDYFGYKENEEKDCAVVKEFYRKRCREYPEGAYIVVANGRWLNPTKDGKVAPLPYKHLINDSETPYPFLHMLDLPVSGSPWGMGTMENLIAPQKGKNKVISQIIENADNFGNIKLLAPKNSDLTKEAFDDSRNEVVEYNDTNGTPPTYLQPVGLPQHVMAQPEMFDKAMMSISGQFEATKGAVPTGVKSGIAIARLQDADDTRINPTMIMYRSMLRKAGKHVLNLYREFMVDDEERVVKILGESGLERHKVSKANLGDNFTIYVDLQSQAAWSREVKREQIQNAYQMGLFGEPNDPKVKRRVLESLEFGHIKNMFEENALDEQNAKENIDRIEMNDLDEVVPAEPRGINDLTGQPLMNPPVYGIKAEPWQDHEEHLRVYNNFRKGPRWKKWTPDMKAMLNQLAEEHAKFLTPPPPPPIQPNVNISAKTDISPEVLLRATGLESPTPPPPESEGLPEPNEIGANQPMEPTPAPPMM